MKAHSNYFVFFMILIPLALTFGVSQFNRAEPSTEVVQGDLAFKFTELESINLGRNDYHSAQKTSTPSLEEDLRVPGAYLYNGNGGALQGFLVQFNSTTATHSVLTGSIEQVNQHSMLNFTLEWPADQVQFSTLSMVTQMNGSHILIPEYKRACIRVFDRDRNTVGPFIGTCKAHDLDLSPSQRPISLPDFSEYSIDNPFSITLAPRSNKLYVVDAHRQGHLHQIDLNTRNARNLGRFPLGQPAYSIILNSDETIGYLRTARKIVKLNLTEAVNDLTNSTSTLKFESAGDFEQPVNMSINDMKWLKQDEVIIVTDARSKGLRIIDLRQNLVSGVCGSPGNTSLLIQNSENATAGCALFEEPDLILISRYKENTIVLSDLITTILDDRIKRKSNRFYQFSFQDLACSNAFLEVNSDTILTNPSLPNSFQSAGTTHSYTCKPGFYIPYSEIRCFGKERQMVWEPAPPNCQSDDLSQQNLSLSPAQGPLHGGFVVSINNGVFPPEFEHNISIVVPGHEAYPKYISGIIKKFDTITFTVPDLSSELDQSGEVYVYVSTDLHRSRSLPLTLLPSPELKYSLPNVITTGVNYAISLLVKHYKSSSNYKLILQPENGELSVCEAPSRGANVDGNISCPIDSFTKVAGFTIQELVNQSFSSVPDRRLELQSYDHVIEESSVKLTRTPKFFTIKSHFDDKVEYTIYGNDVDQFENNKFYRVEAKLPDQPKITLCTATVDSNHINGQCAIEDFVENAEYEFKVFFGNTLIYTTKVKISQGPTIQPGPGLMGVEIAGIAISVIVVVAVILIIFAVFERRRQKELKKQGFILEKLNGYIDADELRKNSDYSILMDKLQRMLIPEELIEFKADEIIGEGNFGRICVGYYQSPNEGNKKVALKSMKGDVLSQEQLTQFVNECLLMFEFDHKNVLPALGVVLPTNQPITVALPHMVHGDLKNLLQRRDLKFTQGELLNFALQIATGMEYLTSKQFIHRDLAARNCLVSEDFTIKVSDFGLSKDIYRNQYYRMNSKSPPLPVKWMALESLTSGSFSSATDMWSFGVVLWELLTRCADPYPDVSPFDIKNYLLTGRRLERPEHCSESVYKLMQSCWRSDISQRPRFDQIILILQLLLTDFKESDLSRQVSTSSVQSTIRVRRLSADGVYPVSCTPSDMKRCVSYESLRTMMYKDTEHPYYKMQYPYPYEQIDYKTMLPDLLV